MKLIRLRHEIIFDRKFPFCCRNFEFDHTGNLKNTKGETEVENTGNLSAVYCLPTSWDARHVKSKSFAMKLVILLLSGEIQVSYYGNGERTWEIFHVLRYTSGVTINICVKKIQGESLLT